MQPISHYDIASNVYTIDRSTGAVQECAKDARHAACLHTTIESLNISLEKCKGLRNTINAINLLALSRLSAALHQYIRDKYPIQSYLWNFCTWLDLKILKKFSQEFQQAFIKQNRFEQGQIAALVRKYQNTPSDQILERIGSLLHTFESSDMTAIEFFFNTRTTLGKTTQLTDYTFALIKNHNLIAKDPVASWPLARRFRQLRVIPQEILASSDSALLDLAHHIESVVMTTPKTFFKRKTYGASRSIIKQDNTLLILTKVKLNEGGHKIVRRGVAVPFNTKQHYFLIADGIHKDMATEDEAKLHAFFGSQQPPQGICPILYSDAKRIITPLGRPITTSTSTFETIIDLAQGIATIHAQGYIHGDLAEKNAIDFQGARLIDFGFCFNPKTTSPPFPKNFYGNVAYTPPEMLHGTEKIDYLAAEVWAFGCLCFKLLYNRPVPWENHVERLYKSSYPDLKVSSLIRTKIENLWTMCHRDDWILRGVLHMLSFYPEDRLRINQVLHYFRSHSGLR